MIFTFSCDLQASYFQECNTIQKHEKCLAKDLLLKCVIYEFKLSKAGKETLKQEGFMWIIPIIKFHLSNCH